MSRKRQQKHATSISLAVYPQFCFVYVIDIDWTFEQHCWSINEIGAKGKVMQCQYKSLNRRCKPAQYRWASMKHRRKSMTRYGTFMKITHGADPGKTWYRCGTRIVRIRGMARIAGSRTVGRHRIHCLHKAEACYPYKECIMRVYASTFVLDGGQNINGCPAKSNKFRTCQNVSQRETTTRSFDDMIMRVDASWAGWALPGLCDNHNN